MPQLFIGRRGPQEVAQPACQLPRRKLRWTAVKFRALEAIKEFRRDQHLGQHGPYRRAMIERAILPGHVVEASQQIGLVRRERAPPSSRREGQHVVDMAGLGRKLGGLNVIELPAQSLGVTPRLVWQGRNFARVEFGQLLVESQAELVGREHEELIVVVEGIQQVEPSLVESHLDFVVQHLVDEKIVLAVVLDAEVEQVPLRLVIGVVERGRDRVAVRRRGLAVGGLRKIRDVLEHSGLETCEGLAFGASQQRRRGAGSRAVFQIADDHPQDRIVIRGQVNLDFDAKRELVPFFRSWHVHLQPRFADGRKVARFQPVRPSEPDPLDLGGGQELNERSLRQDLLVARGRLHGRVPPHDARCRRHCGIELRNREIKVA